MVVSITPATTSQSRGNGCLVRQRYSCAWRGFAIDSTSAADPRLVQMRQQLLQRHVEVVRAFVVAPANVQPHLAPGDVGQRAVDGLDREIEKVEKLGERPIGEQPVPLHRQVRTIDLQHQPLRRDRLVLGPQASATAFTYSAKRAVVVVLHCARDDTRRGSSPERFDEPSGLLLQDPPVLGQLVVERMRG